MLDIPIPLHSPISATENNNNKTFRMLTIATVLWHSCDSSDQCKHHENDLLQSENIFFLFARKKKIWWNQNYCNQRIDRTWSVTQETRWIQRISHTACSCIFVPENEYCVKGMKMTNKNKKTLYQCDFCHCSVFERVSCLL